MFRLASIVVCLLALVASDASAQAPPEQALRIFLDCPNFFCDPDYYRREVNFVDHVRDRQDADVHILVTTQRTGSGTEFSVNFIGLGPYAGVADTVTAFSSDTNTEDEERGILAQVVKMGLMRYVAGSAVANQIQISYGAPERQRAAPAQPEDDPWNFWVFTVRANGSLNSEETQRRYGINGSVQARRITEDWKISLFASGRYDESRFELTDSTEFVNTSENYRFNALVVRSLSDHWSFGVRPSASSSTFLNEDLRLRFAPGIEYNIFPYSESSTRKLTLLYDIGYNWIDYELETINDKLREGLFDQTLTVALDFVQPWGTSNISLSGSNILNEPSNHRLELFGFMNIRLVRGLNFNFFGSIARIKDQRHIAKQGLSDEEILLRRRQQETDFRISTNIGFSYTFGSIFNNVVNPRFGGGERFFFF